VATSDSRPTSDVGAQPFGPEHYKELRRRHVVRLVITYLVPLLLVIVYFQVRYNSLVSQSRRLHLGAIAENQANTLDLFLTERRVNLDNLIDHPKFTIPPTSTQMQQHLKELRASSPAFVDLGFFDSSGVQTAYAGPYPSLEQQNYRRETWYQTLALTEHDFVFTDIYLGFRQRPHFTLAVSREIDGRFVVLRATLDPARMYEYIRSRQSAADAATVIVNEDGAYQLVNEPLGSPLAQSPFTPPRTPNTGTVETSLNGDEITYVYHWLTTADWALVARSTGDSGQLFWGLQWKVLLGSVVLIGLTLVVILNRAKSLTESQRESDETRSQLEHASKLASVGELAAGIAHEINNPLAVISEESGLIMDYMSPEFNSSISKEELLDRLKTIQQSAFRCRDITRKLLNFVRRSELELAEHDVHDIIDGVVVGLLGPEIEVSNIEVVRNYDRNLPPLVTDANQLQQVVLNMLNNASDAIGDKPGTITITTGIDDDKIRVDIADTGHGMTPDQLERVFMPFFTTKEVGKGTGLGLSVSYGIIQSLGGTIEVTSEANEGSTFSILLPVSKKIGKTTRNKKPAV
jgi:two-component system NtrC family sensor kinase